MNIANIFSSIIDRLNESNDCGLCWRFVMGGRRDYLNLVKNDDCCCAVVGITRIVGRKGMTSIGERYTDWELEVFAGIPSDLDIQFYNEVDSCEDAIEQSKWEKYLHPIHCCLMEIDDNICDVHNCQGCLTTVEIQQSATHEMRLNYLDNNYDGWIIRMTIREWRR